MWSQLTTGLRQLGVQATGQFYDEDRPQTSLKWNRNSVRISAKDLTMMALREEDGSTKTGTVAAAGEGYLYTSHAVEWNMYTLPTSNVCRYLFVSYM
jgi:hypothetical protein